MSGKITDNQTITKKQKKNQTTGSNKEMLINHMETVADLVPFQEKPSMLVTNLIKQH